MIYIFPVIVNGSAAKPLVLAMAELERQGILAVGKAFQ